MKTTPWSRDEAEKARPLLERLAADVRVALQAVDEAAKVARERPREFDEAKPSDARTLWVDLVRADETLGKALEDLHRVVKEAEELNAKIDFDRKGELSLAGSDESGRPVYFASAEDGCEAEPVTDLGTAPEAPKSAEDEEPTPEPERPSSAPDARDG